MSNLQERQAGARGSEVDFSWSGEPEDLTLPVGVAFGALENAALVVDEYERYINDPRIPQCVNGDGDSAIILALRIFEAIETGRARLR